MNQTSLTRIVLASSLFFAPFLSHAADFWDIGFHEAEEAILYLSDQGVVQGYEDGSFRPEFFVNRVELLKITLESVYEKGELVNCNVDDVMKTFTDLERNAWYIPYVCFAATKGIINGYPDGTFRPNQRVTLAEAVKIVVISHALPIPHQVEGEWYEPYFQALPKQSRYEDMKATMVPGGIPGFFLTLDTELKRGEIARLLFAVITRDKENNTITYGGPYADYENVKYFTFEVDNETKIWHKEFREDIQPRLLARFQNALLNPETQYVLFLNGLTDFSDVFTELSPDIGKFSNLGSLSLFDNRLTTLPPEIGKLHILTSINLGSNLITSLPPEFYSLTKLEWIHLASNQLTSLPKELGQLKNLKMLDLSGNQLTDLPKEIRFLEKLEKLDLENNPIPLSRVEELRKLLPNAIVIDAEGNAQ